MSKPSSGLFSGTYKNTSYIWNEISATQENYPSTVLPKSFTISTINGNLWIHANATKHINEDIVSGRGSHANDPKLYTQLKLADLHHAVNHAMQEGFDYGKTFVSEHWELNIVKPRNGGKFPVIKHARYIGKE